MRIKHLSKITNGESLVILCRFLIKIKRTDQYRGVTVAEKIEFDVIDNDTFEENNDYGVVLQLPFKLFVGCITFSVLPIYRRNVFIVNEIDHDHDY